VDGKTWEKCKIELFRPGEIGLPQNNKLAEIQYIMTIYMFSNIVTEPRKILPS